MSPQTFREPDDYLGGFRPQVVGVDQQRAQPDTVQTGQQRQIFGVDVGLDDAREVGRPNLEVLGQGHDYCRGWVFASA